MSYGMNGFLGLGKETTWGTAVAATDYVEIMNEGIKAEYDRFDTRNAINAMYEPDRSAGLIRVGGPISVAGFPEITGHLMRAAMNTLSGTTVLSGFLYTTRFVSPQAEFADGVPSQPYTLEIFRDVTSSHRYAGMVLNRLSLAMSPNQPLMLNADFLGKAATLLQKSSPTFVSSPAEPFMFDTASVRLGGSATARVEAFTVSIDNQLEGIPALNNSNQIARIRRRGPQVIRVQGTVDFQDVTEYNDFINQTERAISLALFKSQSFAAVIDVPRMVYTSFSPNIRGRERQTVSFAGEARYKTTSATALGLYITSVTSTY